MDRYLGFLYLRKLLSCFLACSRAAFLLALEESLLLLDLLLLLLPLLMSALPLLLPIMASDCSSAIKDRLEEPWLAEAQRAWRGAGGKQRSLSQRYACCHCR